MIKYTFQETLSEHQTVFEKLSSIEHDINKAYILLVSALRESRKIILCGNGGSAADAQHFAAELTGRFLIEREGLPGIALTTDTSALTAIANDYGYEYIFARQITALGLRGDIVVVISTSGNSPNILRAIEAANNQGCYIIGLTGETGGQMSQKCDVVVKVPSKVTARIQEAHITIIHYWCKMIDESFSA